LAFLLDFPAGATVVVVAGFIFIVANGFRFVNSLFIK